MAWICGEYLWVRRSRERSGPVFVTRRRLGNAVVRNRVRRRLRAVVRCAGLDELAAVVLVRPAAVGAGYKELRQELLELLCRLQKEQPE